MAKTLDLNNLEKNNNNNVQTNLKQLIKKYGKKFKIMYNNLSIPVKIIRTIKKYNKNTNYYSLIYDSPNRLSFLYPLKIDFFDFYESKKNNNCYLANIHKTDTISGTDIMLLAIDFLKKMGVETITLHDDSHITCENKVSLDLSFFKLIEKNITFYQKFGFVFQPKYNIDIYNSFGDEKNINIAINDLIKQFRNIKLSYLIYSYQKILDLLFKVVKTQNFKDFKIFIFHPTEPFISQNKKKLFELIQEIDIILNIIMPYEKKYLYELLIDLFYRKCWDYYILENFILTNNFYGVEYKNKKIFLKHVFIFFEIKRIKECPYKLTLQ